MPKLLRVGDVIVNLDLVRMIEYQGSGVVMYFSNHESVGFSGDQARALRVWLASQSVDAPTPLAPLAETQDDAWR